jgi:hypothetical protein
MNVFGPRMLKGTGTTEGIVPYDIMLYGTYCVFEGRQRKS